MNSTRVKDDLSLIWLMTKLFLFALLTADAVKIVNVAYQQF